MQPREFSLLLADTKSMLNDFKAARLYDDVIDLSQCRGRLFQLGGSDARVLIGQIEELSIGALETGLKPGCQAQPLEKRLSCASVA